MKNRLAEYFGTNELPSYFGKNVRLYTVALNLTPKELSIASGLTLNQISKLSRGKLKYVPKGQIRELAKLFNVTLDHLLTTDISKEIILGKGPKDPMYIDGAGI